MFVIDENRLTEKERERYGEYRLIEHEGLSLTERLMYQLIKQNTDITDNKMIRELGVSSKTISRGLLELEAQGLIKRSKNKREDRFIIL